MNRQTGANVDPNADPSDMLQSNTRGLMAAMSTLPELTERKRTIDKHTTLLGSIVKASRLLRSSDRSISRKRDIIHFSLRVSQRTSVHALAMAVLLAALALVVQKHLAAALLGCQSANGAQDRG